MPIRPMLSASNPEDHWQTRFVRVEIPAAPMNALICAHIEAQVQSTAPCLLPAGMRWRSAVFKIERLPENLVAIYLKVDPVFDDCA